MRAHVMGGAAYSNMMKSWGYQLTDDPLHSDLIVFTGGTDVNPKEYDEEPIEFTGTPDIDRDAHEKYVYQQARVRHIPMFGICRGSQFLTVMNGGKLIQHIDGHTTGHLARLNSGKVIEVTSTHHQMMDPRAIHHEVLAVSDVRRSERYLNDKGNQELFEEYEAVYYPNSNCLAVQWHPEWMNPDAPGRTVVREWVSEMIKSNTK